MQVTDEMVSAARKALGPYWRNTHATADAARAALTAALAVDGAALQGWQQIESDEVNNADEN